MADLPALAASQTALQRAKRHAAPLGVIWQPDVLSAAECAAVSALLDRRAACPAKLTGAINNLAVRDCLSLWLDDDADNDWLFKRLATMIAAVNRDNFDFTLDGIEGVQLLRYRAGTGHYDWHIDRAGGGGAARRKLSFSIQLSPPAKYRGGRLELNGDGHVRAAPRAQGGAVVFPSFVLHRVSPIETGQRDALVGWMEGPAFR